MGQWQYGIAAVGDLQVDTHVSCHRRCLSATFIDLGDSLPRCHGARDGLLLNQGGIYTLTSGGSNAFSLYTWLAGGCCEIAIVSASFGV